MAEFKEKSADGILPPTSVEIIELAEKHIGPRSFAFRSPLYGLELVPGGI